MAHSQTLSDPNVVDPNLNALLPEFESKMTPEYVAAYNANIGEFHDSAFSIDATTTAVDLTHSFGYCRLTICDYYTHPYPSHLGPDVSTMDGTIVGKRLAHHMTVEEYRANPVIAGFGVERGPEVGSISEIKIPVSGDEQILLRIYRPKEQKDTSKLPPVHINFHGGGWVIGRAGDDDSFIRNMVDRTGAVIVDVDYRVAPEYRFPTPLEDCWAAFDYVRTHAADEELKVDGERISIGGFSAGGHIAAFIAQRARDRGVAKCIRLCLMVIPVTDATSIGLDLEPSPDSPHTSWKTNYYAPFLSHARMSWFYKYFLPDPIPSASFLSNPELSPLLHPDFVGLPPTLIAAAEIDVLHSEGIAYANKLAASNAALVEQGKEGECTWVRSWTAKGVPHPFPMQTAVTERAREFFRLSANTMREAYKGDGLVWKSGIKVEVSDEEVAA
ncbi:hypothetical protein DL93DRAFT_2166897 [Clavulina sp. PMI_390]|nr:hypothetical protein DL93DRAFT_2166897 [Clavulina sp. PMI_390]